MKKLLRTALALLLPVAAVLVVVYKVVNKAPSPELPQYEQVWQIFDEGGCLSFDCQCIPLDGLPRIVRRSIDLAGYRRYRFDNGYGCGC